MSLNLSSMRHRNGGKTMDVATTHGFGFTYVDAGKPAPTNSQTWTTVSYRHSKDMWDTVVKDFHRRSKAGEIFNNPMHQVESTFNTSTRHRTGGYNVYRKEDGELKGRVSLNEIFADTEDACSSRRTLTAPIERLQNVALTAAYAGITANTQNAVLWAGEFKETLKMVTDIGTGLLALYRKTAKARKEWAKGKLTIPEAQSLTLGILYGILPLEQSIAQVTEGLFKLKPNGRETSRGFQVYTDSSDKTWTSEKNKEGKYDSTYSLRESLQVTVRAGVLYDIDVSELPSIAVIADPKQVTETAYALARLSFVIDWFINVGSTIKAWSPSIGTKELAAWVSVEEIYEQKFSCSYDRYIRTWPDTTESGSITGSLESSYVTTVKTRYPVNRSDLAILPRLDVNLNFSKLNSLVLLFADAKKKR
uniref:Uncharacterized protein n=1 Tax=de Gerlache virus TaxID=2707285 RepID=A0A6H0DIV4_9VIRU|nr:MAG: hypothetical protein [de Gerlache virus]